ncbi:MAG: cellulase family glycosylhydrolase [Planctomycetota bacterium]|jgi:hypothetical protein
MSKKLIYLVCFVLVLGLAVTSAAKAELVGWWKFDEGSGIVAHDVSGNGNDGTFNGDPQWVVGYCGPALEFDGSGDWLDCGNDPILAIGEAVSISAWIEVGAQGIDHKVGGNQDDSNGGYKMSIVNDKVEFEIRTSGNTFILNRDVAGGTILEVGVWYHVTGVYSQADGYIRTYVNGVLDRELSTTQELGVSPGPFRIGCEPFATGSYNFNGVMDDVRIYNRTLTEVEILSVMEAGELWPYAWKPIPADGALLSDTGVILGWRPGAYAVSHDVYFGDNLDDVNAGTGDTFQGNQTATRFRVGSSRRNPYLPDLVGGTTYYWRIDEVNDLHSDSPWKGDVWSFMTPPKTAYDPYPADGAKFIAPNMTLSWTAGYRAKLHNVYFGDNFDEVNVADTSDTTGIYRGVQAATTYTPGPLELEKTYYWRVDEDTAERVEKTHKGDVWSFRTTLEPAALHVEGSRIITDDGSTVRLQGVNVASLEWSNTGEHVLESVRVAIYDWNSNTIRLPLSQERWFGEAEWQSDNGRMYRLIVDEVIQYISENGCYVILDLHCSRCEERWGSNPDMGSVDFWKSVATRYADEPAVLFGLYNEPHDISWDTWKSGGWITERREVGEETYMAPGMQDILDAVRSTGASNIAVVGGLDWGYDLRGIPEYALDDPYGNIMYDTHIYPWKGNEEDWDGRVGHVIGKYPILVGEVMLSGNTQFW